MIENYNELVLDVEVETGTVFEVMDEKVKQIPSAANANYEVLFSETPDNEEHIEFAKKSNHLTYNPSTGNLNIVKINGSTVGSEPKFTDTTYEDATENTHGLMSTTDKIKLDGIEGGAQVNVQSDWDENDNTADDYIKNKPSINDNEITIQLNGTTVDSFTLNQDTDKTVNIVITKDDVGLDQADNTSDLDKPVSTATQTALNGKVDIISGKGLSTEDFTTAEKSKLNGIESGAEVNVQSDFAQTNTSADDFIKNKPTKVSDFQNDLNFIDNTVNDLVNYYPKTQTYTKTEVDTEISSAISRVYKPSGNKTCAELVHALLVESNLGNVYNITDSGTTTADFVDGAGKTIEAGDNVVIVEVDGVYKFDLLTGFIDLSGYQTKALTTAVESQSTVEGALSALSTNKVAKEQGKGLSVNDFTNELKSKLDGIEDQANKTIVDDYLSPISENPVENNVVYSAVTDLLTEATETGNPISITNASGLNAKSLKVELEPIQDLNGYDSPWVGGGGKNKLPLILSDIKTINTSGTWTGNTYVLNGITYEVQTDTNGNITGIKATGTASANGNFRVYQTDNPTNTQVDFFANKILNGCPTNGTTSTYFEYIQIGTSSTLGRDLGSEYSTPADMSGYYGVTQIYVGISVRNGFECPTGGLLFKPMLRLSTEADGTFAPYSNICPISGRTQTVVSVNSEDTTIPFNQTVYGGEVDVTSGGTSDKYDIIDLGTINWIQTTAGGHTVYRTEAGAIPFKNYGNTRTTQGLCSGYKVDTTADNGTCFFYGTSFYLRNDNFASETACKNGLSGIILCYEKATPTTISTPSNEISLLKGNNTLTGEGDMELVYSTEPKDCYTKTETDTLLNGKVDKVSGKGLSTEDFTTAEKNKLSGIEAEANKTVVDNALDSTSANPVENRVVKSALDEKLNADETAVNSNGLVIATPVTDTAPYIYRQTPVKESFKALMHKIVGASVVWNQLGFKTGVSATAQYTPMFQQQGIDNTTDVINGHKYYLSFVQPSGCRVYRQDRANITVGWLLYEAPTQNTRRDIVGICTESGTGVSLNPIITKSGTTEEAYSLTNCMFVDLTAMFGTTIADYVYTLETAEAGSGIAWLQSYGFFTEDYYAYTQNKLESGCVSAHKTYDGETLLTNTELSPITLRGLFNLSSDKLTVDGDEYNADGTVTRKKVYRKFKLSDFSKTATNTNTEKYYLYNAFGKECYADQQASDLNSLCVCGSRINYEYNNNDNVHFYYVGTSTSITVFVPIGTPTTTDIEFIATLVTPTTEQTTPFTEAEIVGNTEEFIDYEVAQNTRDVAIPVGTDTDYYQEMKLPPLPTTSGNHNLIYNPSTGFGWS